MTLNEFDTRFADCEFDEDYADFIMQNVDEERNICNGNMLTIAMEDLYLYEEFRDYAVDYMT